MDVLNRIGSGGEGSLSISRPIPWDRFRFTPSIRLNYMMPRLTRHDYGVSAAEATTDRPAYRPGSALNPEAGFSIFAEITPKITGAIISSIEWFDSSIRQSPIVEDHYVIKGTAFVVYMF
jgi:outer membrane scaffolding protein for murein synthesis (MipA/OmpV family)